MGNYTPNPFMTQPVHLPPLCTCTSCKNRMQLEWQFKPTNIDKLKNQVPKVSLGTAEFPNIILDS